MVNSIVNGADKKGMGWLYFAMYLAIIIVVIIVIAKVYKAFMSGANAVGNAAADAARSGTTGISLARLTHIRTAAEALWNNGTGGHHWFTPSQYNEEMFIETINKMANTAELAALCDYYQEYAKESLKYSVDESFTDSDKAKLKATYYSSLS
jgi:hypothetical protein